MSTNKRFNLVKCKGNRWGIEDNILEKEDTLFFICREGQFETNGLVLLLNQLNDKNEQLEKENLDLTEELDYYKTKCASLETGYIKAEDENWRLEKTNMEFANELGKTIDENEQLKNEKESWKKSWIEEMEAQEEQSKCILKLVNENEKLKSELGYYRLRDTPKWRAKW